jgi:hypothetical protein
MDHRASILEARRAVGQAMVHNQRN